jgi:phosphoglycerate dehydrogenase-like enzyme
LACAAAAFGADLLQATRLRLIHKFGAGVNTIDVDTATKRGIAVANMPGANAPSVAEGAVLLMLATLRRLPALDRAVSGRCPQDTLDIVSLHLPSTDDTRGLLGRDPLTGMKPGAVLINTSRGPIVDEGALVDALRGGRLAAAGLDVFDAEPVPPDNPLLRLDNVVLTPHVTWYTVDTMRLYLVEAVAKCRRLRDGKLGAPPACGGLAHVVNQPTGY